MITEIYLIDPNTTQNRAQPDWAYEFPHRTGPDTKISRTGLNPDLYFTNQMTEFQ